jgi:pyruvate ferredoxin oxidoreductase alpha subunit
MRAAGRKVGLLNIRVFRPFPGPEIADALKGVSKVAVLDKNISLGSGGAVGTEVKAALQGSGISVYDYIIALGGRDVRKRDIAAVVDLAEKGEGDMFYGLRTEVL